MAKKLKAALIGFGGMGHFHATQYKKQKNCELVAICDIDKKKFEKLSADINLGNSGDADLSNVCQYLSYEDLIKNEKFDFLDICLPCHLHAEYAIRAMKYGYHVLCEKPMARDVKLADQMIEVSEKTKKFLMIAQCLRFEKTFNTVKQAYDSGKYGRLLRLSMTRCGGAPSQGWYRDVKCSGGAILDLHLHDTDFINYMIGVPDAVLTSGVTRVSGGFDDLMTTYYFDNGPIVNSEGSWCRSKWGCTTVAVFEKATMEIAAPKVIVHMEDKKDKEIDCTGTNGYFNEIAYFSECILKNRRPVTASVESTRDSIRIVLAEEKSARTNRKVFLKK